MTVAPQGASWGDYIDTRPKSCWYQPMSVRGAKRRHRQHGLVWAWVDEEGFLVEVMHEEDGSKGAQNKGVVWLACGATRDPVGITIHTCLIFPVSVDAQGGSKLMLPHPLGNVFPCGLAGIPINLPPLINMAAVGFAFRLHNCTREGDPSCWKDIRLSG